MKIKDYNKYVKNADATIVNKYVKSKMSPMCLEDMLILTIASISSIIALIAGVSYVTDKSNTMLYILIVSSLYFIVLTMAYMCLRVVGLDVVDGNVVIGSTWGIVAVIPKQDITYALYKGSDNELFLYGKGDEIICTIDVFTSRRVGFMTVLSSNKIKVKSMTTNTYYFVRPSKVYAIAILISACILLSVGIPTVIFSLLLCIASMIIGAVLLLVGNNLMIRAKRHSINVTSDLITFYKNGIKSYSLSQLQCNTDGSVLYIKSKDGVLHMRVTNTWENSDALLKYLKKKGIVPNGVFR